MSGGVDSSVTAALLLNAGYEVIGITIKTYNFEDVGGNVGNDSSCCSLDGINDARRICLKLGIPHYTVDFSESFRRNVIDYFISDYMEGNTPNPCVVCNRTIKWGEMLRKADSLGAEFIAMGHYARTRFDETLQRWIVSRGRDTSKDQSYMLWDLRQDQIARTLFPLADYTKAEARAEGKRLGLDVAEKKDSYEICFIPDDDYRRFLRDNVQDIQGTSGPIVFEDKVIGKHSGYPFYTVGQRRGLGISFPEPLYVLEVLPESNTVVLGRESDLVRNTLLADSVNLIKYESITKPIRSVVKVRYKDEGSDALAYVRDQLLYIEFHQPRKAITPGQSVVVYEGDDIIAGGIIRGSDLKA